MGSRFEPFYGVWTNIPWKEYSHSASCFNDTRLVDSRTDGIPPPEVSPQADTVELTAISFKLIAAFKSRPILRPQASQQ
jgi:hypothetical protein